MAAVEPIVDFGTWVMRSKLMEIPVCRKVIMETVKHTFYEHFCAGQDVVEVGKTVKMLKDEGLKGMLDYGLEHALDNQSCDRNFQEFYETIDLTQSLPPGSVSFVVVKITAICPHDLLKRVSDLLRWENKDSSFKLPWKHETLPLFADSSPMYHTQEKPEPLTLEEERDLELAHERLRKLCEKCLETNIPLLLDAEETLVNPGIDYFTYSSAIAHHKDDTPFVFGTIQTYLKDAKERMVIAKKAADKMGVPMGFKLVRGAYMSTETELANALGVASPIQDSIQHTHASYNSCTSFMLEEIAKGSGAVVLATHNVESGKLAATKAVDLGISNNEKLHFAQLYGMAEVLSYGLRNAGFQVSKYLPFGPVEQIIPYLIRRAEENRGLLSTSVVDRTLMRKELMRRVKA